MSGEQRIQIDVPLATPYEDIHEMIFRQAWEKSGTQLRAAFNLGITPETISRFLTKRQRERERLARPGIARPPANTSTEDPAILPPGGQENEGSRQSAVDSRQPEKEKQVPGVGNQVPGDVAEG